MDYEEITITNIMNQLSEMQSNISKIGANVAVIMSEQANIKSDLTEHKAGADKGGLAKTVDVIKSWIFPIVCAIFLLGRTSVESPESRSTIRLPKSSDSGAYIDCTYVADRNKKLDARLMKLIVDK